MISLSRIVRRTEVLTPPRFQAQIQEIEYREDPLTHIRCRINRQRAGRPEQAPQVVDLGRITEKPLNCPFCPENVERATPFFPSDICPQGRIKRGECLLFPNLFPFAEYHATATLSHEHFLPLDGFTPQMVRDNLAAACEYIAFVRRRDSEARYPLYIWNHLMPSAASIVHPHTHILVERRATPYQERLLTSSRRYFRNSGGSFWKEIVAEERKRGERYIGGCGSVSVIASFAPQGNREVQLIISGASSLAQLREEQIGDFAHAVVKILLCYHQMGVNSFNLSTFSAPEGEGLDYYSLNAKVISRPIMQPFYRNDTGIMERLHYETADIEIEPEEVARAMRGFF